MAESNPIRVITVDDHAILRGGLKFLLLAFDDIELVGEARSGLEAVRLCDELQPDVILMDMMMPDMDGVATTRAIKEHSPDIQVLVLSSFSDHASVQQVMQAGAVGYLLKDVPMDELADGIRAAAAGKTVLAPEAAEALVRAAGPQAPQPGYDLTARQLEILALLVGGLTNNEIAERLVLSPYTVRNHVSEILSKLDTSTRTEAAALAMRLGLVG
ncbi:MAG: response regulator transcription factor [Anaerolineae bacterium]|jgi:NarL family two-component system response regulator LiaR